MRIAVMAAGAVGGYFGGRMAAAGHDVAFTAQITDVVRLNGTERGHAIPRRPTLSASS
jgi:2-dehydropantoate 2-reductase